MKLLISNSGGETSAMMTYLLLNKRHGRKIDDHVVLFANTGEENEETLEFVNACDRIFGFNTIWLEADVNPSKGEGTGYKVVTFETASRKGEPFEAVIKKYGLPGPGRLHCTRELKLNPMLAFMEDLGWKDYKRAIGIRADERGRRSPDAGAAGVLYPLLDWWPTTKPQVNEFWMAQDFRLRLTGYQGNCKWCWKKSMRKHMTLLSEDPSKYDFPERMDALYGNVGHEFDEGKAEYPYRTMFRGNLSTLQLRAAYEANKDTLEKAEDDAIVLPHNGELFPLDVEEQGCVEACEVTFEAAA